MEGGCRAGKSSAAVRAAAIVIFGLKPECFAASDDSLAEVSSIGKRRALGVDGSSDDPELVIRRDHFKTAAL